MRRTTVTLPDEIAEMLDSEARRRRTTISEVVRQLVVQGFSGSPEKPRPIPWAGLFHDPGMIPAEHLDQILQESWADDIDRDRG
jgi:hypothetical protein